MVQQAHLGQKQSIITIYRLARETPSLTSAPHPVPMPQTNLALLSRSMLQTSLLSCLPSHNPDQAQNCRHPSGRYFTMRPV